MSLQGHTQRSTNTFEDEDGELVDPTAVVCRVREPDETETTYTYGVDAEVVNTSTGLYYCLFTPDTAGRWICRWVGTTGAVATTSEELIDVEASLFDTP